METRFSHHTSHVIYNALSYESCVRLKSGLFHFLATVSACRKQKPVKEQFCEDGTLLETASNSLTCFVTSSCRCFCETPLILLMKLPGGNACVSDFQGGERHALEG